MREDPFVVLGVKRGATQQEIYNAYKNLKSKYSEDRFLEGEAGADAAKMLEKIETAYTEALDYSHESAFVEEDANLSANKKIGEAIRVKDFELAQKLLDEAEVRDAEWHYLQSVVFVQRKWFADAKKQLEIAIELDPSEAKYKTALEKLESKFKTQNANANQNQNFEQSNRSYGGGATNFNQNPYDRSYQQQNASDTACSVCQGLICADCCCECMGGDLISCC